VDKGTNSPLSGSELPDISKLQWRLHIVSTIGTTHQCSHKQSTVYVSQKNHLPPATCGFLTFFTNGRILNQFFTHLLYVPIYARLQIFIELPQILTKLCHIKRNYLVHMLKMSTIGRNARCLWQVIPDLLL